MTDILERFATGIDRPDHQESRTAARERQAVLTKPAGYLGRLEELSVWLAGVQGVCPTRPLEQVRVVVFAATTASRRGSLGVPRRSHRQMVRNVLAGGAAVNALARLAGAQVRVVDMAVDADLSDLPAAVGEHKVRRGSGRIDVEDALTRDEVERAFAAGIAIADG